MKAIVRERRFGDVRRTMKGAMDEKVCLITGATSGIGKATAMGLANMGASVVMVGRDLGRGEAALTEIKEQSANASVDLMLADLSSQEEVRRLADEIKEAYPRLDVLINNAGLFRSQRIATADGLETTFAVNHLAYFLLTNLLLDLLKSSAPSRIVNVSSGDHSNGTIDFDDLQGEKGYKGAKAYSQSKLANVLFTHELARRLEGTGVTANCLHPGAGIRTNFGSGVSGVFGFVVRAMKPLMMSPEKGAETSVYLAYSQEVESLNGRYFVKNAEARSSAASYDERIARRLWEVSAKLTNPPGGCICTTEVRGSNPFGSTPRT
jgi:NAD(P)-dependent dehydrogenase (short-subunit alcohol dehydrogenase family)